MSSQPDRCVRRLNHIRGAHAGLIDNMLALRQLNSGNPPMARHSEHNKNHCEYSAGLDKR